MTLGLGVVVRTGWAVAVAVRGTQESPTFAGRWSVELVPDHLPRQPYHAAAELPLTEAERLVDEVEQAASVLAHEWLQAAVTSLPDASQVSLVANPGVQAPATVADGFRTHTAMHGAEGALYRDCFVDAMAALDLTTQVIAADELPASDDLVRSLGLAAGRPWRREHKDAARAALLSLT
jgi:hypothetical protein